MTSETKSPGWLLTIANNHVYDKKIEIPWRELLTDSVFCPMSGGDPSPIRLFEEKAYSFIFADHEASKEQILDFIKSIPEYDIFELRTYDYFDDLEHDALKFIQTQKGDGKTNDLIFYTTDPDPCVWAVLEKKSQEGESQANRISLFFMCQEACLAFGLLYRRLGIPPKYILMPETTGREYWTDLKAPNMYFLRMLRERFPDFPMQNVLHR